MSGKVFEKIYIESYYSIVMSSRISKKHVSFVVRNLEVLFILMLILVAALFYWNPIGYLQNESDWYTDYAFDFFDYKNDVKAMQFLDSAINADSLNVEAIYLKGLIYLNQYKYKEASNVSDFLCSMPDKKAFSRCNYLRGKMALLDCDYNDSIEFFLNSVESDNQHIESYLFLALSYYRILDYDNALAILERADKIRSSDNYNSARINILRAYIYDEIGYYNDAMIQFEKARLKNIESFGFESKYILVDCLIFE